MDDCIFCKIARGEIPAEKIYEDKDVLAFLDIKPTNKGHTLIIPKEHYETILDIPDTTLKKLIVVIKKLSKAVFKGTTADGFNIGMNNYKAAGQFVMHAHFHIMPRYEKDGLVEWGRKEYSDGEEIKETAKKIKSLL